MALLAGTAAAAVIAAGIWPVRGSAPSPQAVPKAPPPTTFASSICATDPVEDTKPDPAWLSASFGGDGCRAPAMPARLDGYSASREQIVAAMAAASAYVKSANAYQKCITDFAALQGKAAARSFQLVENHRILVAEKNKRLIAGRTKAAIIAFNEYGSECVD